MSNVFNEYPASNGVGPYSITFEYQRQEDVVVLYRRPETERYEVQLNTDWSFVNATTIELNAAPSDDFDIVRIQRNTEVNPLRALFYPGSAIRAQDLNANFEQLMFAIEEEQQNLSSTSDYIEQFFWNKLEDTVKEEDQTSGRVNTDDLIDDDHIFTTAAAVARHDAYVQDNKPADLTYEQLGKIWNDTDALVDYFWDSAQGTWVSLTKSGPPGPIGGYGPPGHVIVSDFPPTQYPEIGDNAARPLEPGDLWFNSNFVMLYVYYVDNTGPQWVSVAKTGPAGPAGPEGPAGDLQDAPDDGTLYGRQNEQWVEAQEVFTADSPLQMSNTNELQFVWSSMNSLP